MDWDAYDLITAFARFKLDDEEKVSYILLWWVEKRPGYLQKLDMHKGGRQKKVYHYSYDDSRIYCNRR